jgi:hypothetical protein
MKDLLQFGVVRKTKNVAGTPFYVVRRISKWFNEVNEFFETKYGIDAVLYNHQYHSQVSHNGYRENPDGTRVKENNGFYYIQSDKF